MTGFAALCETPLCTLLDSQTNLAGIANFYFSDPGFTTTGTDTPADTNFGRIMKAPTIESSVVRSGGFFGFRAIRSSGDIELANPDGELDQLPDEYSIDGRAVRIKIGGIDRDESGTPTPWPYVDFFTVLSGRGIGWAFTESRLRLSFQANDALLSIPFSTDTYGGTGGADGDADLKGTKKPLSYGRIENVTPILVDSANLIYQVHNRDINAITEVHDRGVSLSAGVDRANYAALVANDPGAGFFDTALAEGLFRVHSPPDGAITCDVDGDAFGGYINKTGDIVKRWMGLAGIDSELVESGAIESFNSLQPADVGYYIRGGNVSFAQALDEFVGGASGFWCFGGNGKLVLRRIDIPTGGETFGEDQILRITREPLPYGVPPFRISVGWQKMWTVQGDSDIAGGADKSHARLVGEEYRFAESVDSSVKTKHLLARDPPFIRSFYALEADAQTEATRMMALYSEDRRLFSVLLKHPAIQLGIGSQIRLQHSRWGLSSAKPFVVVGIRHDLGRNQIEVRCFG